MNDRTKSVAHWSFWAISILMLIWNAMGSVNFIMQMDPDMMASYRASERSIVEGRPIWATAAFAIAVFGGALGCLMLILKKRTAIYLFWASLLGMIVTQAHTLSRGIEFGTGEILGIIIMPVVVSGFLIWYANFSKRKGWID